MFSQAVSWARLSAYRNEEERRAARIQLAALTAYWLACLAAVLADSLLNHSALAALLLSGAALQAPSLYLLLRGRLRASLFLSAAAYVFFITFLATRGQGIHDYVVIAYPAVMMFSGLILGRRGLFVSAALVAGAVFWLAAGELLGWYVPRKDFAPGWMDVVAAEILVSLTLAAAFLLVFYLEESAARSRRERTERAIAEDTLRRHEIHIRSLFENAVVGIYRTAPDGEILFANPSAVRALGYDSFDELASRNLEREGFESELTRSLFLEKMRNEGFVSGLESVWRRKDGSLIHVRESAAAVKDKDGNILFYDGIFEDVTEHKRAEESLREAREQFDRFFNVSLDLFCIADVDGYFRRLNPEWQNALGYPLSELEGAKFLDLIHPDDVPATRDALARLRSGELILNFENRYRHQDGSYRWIEWRSTPVGDLIYAAARDVTERKRMEEELEQSRRMYRLLADNVSDSIWICDLNERRLIYASPSSERLTGYTVDELKSLDILETFDSETFAPLRKKMRQRAAAFLQGENASYTDEIQQIRKDGSLAFFEITTSFHLSSANGHIEIYGVSRDVTERKKHEELLRETNEQLKLRVAEVEDLHVELREQSVRDPLTGLYNRRYMQDALQREFARALRETQPLSVVMLDMDDLKLFNDTHGHGVGDDALRALAACLKSMTRIEDAVFRYGGDEFVVALIGATAQDALRKTEEWREFLANHPLETEQGKTPIRFTAGIASFPAHALSLEELVHYADIALYRAKARGRDCSQIFS